ncbi:MAG: folP [Rickettsiaceae bacterium]|jgi:2-amino-4-hydroxy-6-hydroxymethyldihydropteridine diphosphokinase|nr:folP [Rickettsiaceae bacterium]
MVILGLGSNVGDRLDYLSKAVSILGKSVLAAIELSPIYESPAVLNPGAPEDWNKTYLNMAVCGETHFSPLELLKAIKMIEKSVGRQDRGVWAPREIDIDILAYDSNFIDTTELTIPHKNLYKRPFALMPLVDVAPNWQCPVPGAFQGKTAYAISDELFGVAPGIVKTELKVSVDSKQVA